MANGGHRPRWSPDGSQITFRSFHDQGFHVWVMPAIGGTATKVTSTYGGWSNPAWSPDGTRLAHVVKDSAAAGPHAEIYAEHARNDYSWNLPNRRFIHQGLYLPQLKNPELGQIALLVDTSGSISQKELNQFASEIQGILAAYKTDIIVIYVDAAVQGYDLISSADTEINLEPKGGGGTDYRPGYDWLQKQGDIPTAAIYLTDGYCNSFPEEPNFPTLWVLTQGSVYFKPPFGEILVIDRDESN